MPTLAYFYGIRVRIHWFDHAPPNVHVDYQGHDAVLNIETLDFIEGSLPRRARALLLEWASGRRAELRDAWGAVQNGQHPPTIEPLR